MSFQEIAAQRERPLPLIFGTDWWTDCDDVAALDLLLRAHAQGLVDLKAIGVNSVMRYSAPSVKAMCEQYGLGDIPIGLDRAAERKGFMCLYQKKLASFCASGFVNADCPEAYKLYRAALASVAEKAVIVEVGFPQILTELLQSSPDEFSGLGGERLVSETVKEIVVMGGRWDRSRGMEYNFFAYPVNRKAAAFLCGHCPVPLTFLGYETGKSVITCGKHTPGLTGIAYAAHFSPRGRSSWDPMTALYAVTDNAAEAGYRKVRGRAAVNPKTGANSFTPDPSGPHAYLVKEKEDEFYREQINGIFGND